MNPRFLFQAAAYMAIVSLVGGLWIRYERERRRTDTRVLQKWGLRDLGRWEGLFCLGLLLLLLGHLAGVVFPREILHWNSVAARLYVLEASSFGAALLASAGWVGIIRGRVRRCGGTLKQELADEVFLTLLLVVLLTGTSTAVIYRWGSSWGVVTLTPYVRSLLRSKPLVELAAELPFLVRLHVFSAFLVLLFFPFTRPAQILVVVIDRAARRVINPVFTRFEHVQQALRLILAKRNPAEWLWPEED
jgi:nitrate reductase gamma subunit